MGETVQYDRQRNIRFTAEQDDALELMARQESMSVSSLIRRALIRALSLPIDGSVAPTMSGRASSADLPEGTPPQTPSDLGVAATRRTESRGA